MSSAASQEKLVARLNAARRSTGKECANCTAKGPNQVCMDFHTFVCMTCSGIHIRMQHKCKGISMAKWSPEEVKSIEEAGNLRDAAIFLGTWDPRVTPKPDSSNHEALQKFIQDKYHDKRWYVLPSVALAEKEKKDETKIAPPSAPPPPTPDLKKETEKKDSPPEKRPPPPPAVDLLGFGSPAKCPETKPPTDLVGSMSHTGTPGNDINSSFGIGGAGGFGSGDSFGSGFGGTPSRGFGGGFGGTGGFGDAGIGKKKPELFSLDDEPHGNFGGKSFGGSDGGAKMPGAAISAGQLFSLDDEPSSIHNTSSGAVGGLFDISEPPGKAPPALPGGAVCDNSTQLQNLPPALAAAKETEGYVDPFGNLSLDAAPSHSVQEDQAPPLRAPPLPPAKPATDTSSYDDPFAGFNASDPHSLSAPPPKALPTAPAKPSETAAYRDPFADFSAQESTYSSAAPSAALLPAPTKPADPAAYSDPFAAFNAPDSQQANVAPPTAHTKTTNTNTQEDMFSAFSKQSNTHQSKSQEPTVSAHIDTHTSASLSAFTFDDPTYDPFTSVSAQRPTQAATASASAAPPSAPRAATVSVLDDPNYDPFSAFDTQQNKSASLGSFPARGGDMFSQPTDAQAPNVSSLGGGDDWFAHSATQKQQAAPSSASTFGGAGEDLFAQNSMQTKAAPAPATSSINSGGDDWFSKQSVAPQVQTAPSGWDKDPFASASQGPAGGANLFSLNPTGQSLDPFGSSGGFGSGNAFGSMGDLGSGNASGLSVGFGSNDAFGSSSVGQDLFSISAPAPAPSGRGGLFDLSDNTVSGQMAVENESVGGGGAYVDPFAQMDHGKSESVSAKPTAPAKPAKLMGLDEDPFGSLVDHSEPEPTNKAESHDLSLKSSSGIHGVDLMSGSNFKNSTVADNGLFGSAASNLNVGTSLSNTHDPFHSAQGAASSQHHRGSIDAQVGGYGGGLMGGGAGGFLGGANQLQALQMQQMQLIQQQMMTLQQQFQQGAVSKQHYDFSFNLLSQQAQQLQMLMGAGGHQLAPSPGAFSGIQASGQPAQAAAVPRPPVPVDEGPDLFSGFGSISTYKKKK